MGLPWTEATVVTGTEYLVDGHRRGVEFSYGIFQNIEPMRVRLK